MKKTTLSIVSVLALSGLSFAGGNIAPIVPIEEPIIEAPVVMNDSAFYIGLGYSYLSSNRVATLNTPGEPKDGKIVKDTDSNGHNILLQAGYQFNQYFAVEGRYTLSVSDLTLVNNLDNGSEKKADIDVSNIALYLKPMYPIGDFSIYGLLGYGETKRNHTLHSFHWGLGAQYAIKDNLLIFADYTRWYDEEDETHPSEPRLLDTVFPAISIGLTYKF